MLLSANKNFLIYGDFTQLLFFSWIAYYKYDFRNSPNFLKKKTCEATFCIFWWKRSGFGGFIGSDPPFPSCGWDDRIGNMTVKSQTLSSLNLKHKFPLFCEAIFYTENMVINKMWTVKSEHCHGSNCYVSLTASKRRPLTFKMMGS